MTTEESVLEETPAFRSVAGRVGDVVHDPETRHCEHTGIREVVAHTFNPVPATPLAVSPLGIPP